MSEEQATTSANYRRGLRVRTQTDFYRGTSVSSTRRAPPTSPSPDFPSRSSSPLTEMSSTRTTPAATSASTAHQEQHEPVPDVDLCNNRQYAVPDINNNYAGAKLAPSDDSGPRHPSRVPGYRREHHGTPFDALDADYRRRHPTPTSSGEDDPMFEDEHRRCRHGKKPDQRRNGAPSPMGPPGGGPPSSHHSQSERAISSLLSIPPKSMLDFYMSLSDVHKAFSDVGKLTGGDTWPMWKFCVETALDTIIDFHTQRGGRTIPQEISHAVFNVMAGHIADSVMANYLNESRPEELMRKLKERFNPKTTISDANEIFQLFHLCRPIYEMDKLLDDAVNIVSKLAAKGIELPDVVIYSAIIGIIPPAYNSTRMAYEQVVRANTTPGATFEPKPDALIAELRREFNNWRLTHPKTNESKGSLTLVPRDKHTSTQASSSKSHHIERTQKTGSAAAPYKKEVDKRNTTRELKCFNCNETGHMTPDCPKAWTEKSKEAMKRKGITRKSASTARVEKKKSGNTASSSSTAATANMATTSTISNAASRQSAWIASLSDADVEMNVSTLINFTLPAFTASSSNDKPVHILDTGATIHCTPYRNLLFNVHAVPTVLLTVANSEQLVLNLAGDMVVEVDSEQDTGTPNTITLQNVYFNSSLPFTLISVGKLDKEYRFIFYNGHCTIHASNTCIGVVKKLNDLYTLSSTIPRALLSVHTTGITLYDLHKKLGHISYFQINKLLEMSKLIITEQITDRTETQCKDCIVNNIRRNPVPKKRTSPFAAKFGDHFHIDIFGPMPTESITGKYLYWLTIVDNATRWLALAPLCSKDEAYTQWVTFSTKLLTQYGIRVKILQSDNDRVFTSSEFTDYLKTQGTEPCYTVHDTPQQNGVAERVHQTIMNFI
jgi:hypothetical protein